MNFILLWIDIYIIEGMYGFGVFQFKIEKEDDTIIRNLLGIYWNEGEVLIDFLWFHILD